jgi:recombination protein U
MTTYANRGRNLEHAIRELFKQYNKLNIHCQQNHPEMLQDGTFARKHGFDFQMFYKGTFWAFDAKECNLKNWPLDKAKPHQLKALLDVENNGGKAFFLVYFKYSKRLVKFSARMIQYQLEMGHKTVSPDMGEATTINLLNIQGADNGLGQE